MNSSQIGRIQEKLVRIQHLDSQGQVLFGAQEHKYQLNPPAPPELVREFEEYHQIALPDGYREFLLKVGNGGAGPYYGLNELKLVTKEDLERARLKTGQEFLVYNETHPEWDAVSFSIFSSLPEHLAANYQSNQETSLEHEEALTQFLEGMKERALTLGSQGCSIDTLLVIDGPCSGQMWAYDHEALHDMQVGFWPQAARQSVSHQSGVLQHQLGERPLRLYSISPFHQKAEEGLAFLDWYEHWLNTGLLFIGQDISF